MKQSWLVVNNITKTPNGNRWDLTRTVYAIGTKAKRLARAYQYELNNNRTMEECIKDKVDFFIATAIPWNQARDYVLPHIRKAIAEAPEFKDVTHANPNGR